MSNPSIADARDIAYMHRKRGVIVIFHDGSTIGGVSYGMTRAECNAMGNALNEIMDRLLSGEISMENTAKPKRDC